MGFLAFQDKLHTLLERNGSLGPAFQLRCHNHPDSVTAIQSPERFEELVGDGGCTRQCEVKLPRCGHRCPRRCHPDDPAHRDIACPKPCPRLHEPCGHVCRKMCSEECGECLEPIPSVALPCGHTRLHVPCHLAAEPASLPCMETLKATVPRCGHEVSATCGDPKLRGDPALCDHMCESQLNCGHSCRQVPANGGAQNFPPAPTRLQAATAEMQLASIDAMHEQRGPCPTAVLLSRICAESAGWWC